MCQKGFLRTCIILLMLVIVEVVSLSSTPHLPSGLYVDSGQDQTMIHKLTTNRERLILEREILKLLGLPDRPMITNGKAPLMARSAPKFLLNIYNNASGSKVRPKQNISPEITEFHLSDQEWLNVDKSDVIITFTAQQSNLGPGVKPERVKRMWFNTSAVTEDEELTSAELRLYRGSGATNNKNHGAFTITVFRVIQTKNGVREMQFVDTIESPAGQQGWITLNITESLHYWMTNPGTNKGLYLSVNPIGRSDHDTRPENIGIVGFKGDLERQPFMAGFFKSTGLKQGRVNQQTLMSLELDYTRNRRNDAEDLLKGHYPGDTVNNEATSSCKLRTLFVNFKDLQWEDWIIAPEGYDAYFCNGECKFPLNHRVNATNHAIVQGLLSLMKPEAIPKPCCTPTDLSAISVLYFVDDNNVIFKKFKDMVVRGCGCH